MFAIVYMRKVCSFIIISLMMVFLAGLVRADSNYNVFASLKFGVPLEEVSPLDFSDDELEPARGRFLVASRRSQGSFFSGTVIFLLNHNDQGSTGLVINRPSHVTLSTAFPEEITFKQSNDLIYTGGPVELGKLFVLIKSETTLSDSRLIVAGLYITSNLDMVKHEYNRLRNDKQIRVFAGYAGWGPGQLMNEVKRGSWHVMTGDTELIFDENHEGLWEKFIQRKENKLKK